ncbi:MAG: tetratricopeptide repeat protein [bacterium]
MRTVPLQNRRWLIAGIGLGVILITGFWDFRLRLLSNKSAIPDPDYAGTEAPVMEKLTQLRKEVERDPKSARHWGKLAMNLYVHDFQREAIPCFQQAATLDPKEFRWSYYCAFALSEAGSPEALVWYERSRALNPNYTPGQVRCGQALLAAGELEKAEVSFQTALNGQPKLPHAYLGAAKIALERNDLPAAREYALKALTLAPRFREARSIIAETYRRSHDMANAEHHMQLAEKLPAKMEMPDPVFTEMSAEGVSSFWRRMRASRHLAAGRYDQAVHELQLALAVRPDAEAHNNLGMALQYQGEFSAAAEHYRQALVLNPGYVEALNNLSVALFETGQIAEAIAQVEKAVQLDSTLPDAYLNLGTFCKRAGRTAEARHAFQQGMRHAPNDARLAYQLAWLLATASETEFRNGKAALQLAKTLCEKTANRSPGALDALAAAYAENRQFEAAVQTAQQAQQLAVAEGQRSLANQIQARLQLYKSKTPYREVVQRGER